MSGDNKESIKKYIDLSLEQRLLDCIAVINLHFRHYGEMHDMWEFQSDIEKDPEKFGYKIKIPEQNQENNFEFVWWENEWTNRDDIKEFNTEYSIVQEARTMRDILPKTVTESIIYELLEKYKCAEIALNVYFEQELCCCINR